jgi:hypothetical protein
MRSLSLVSILNQVSEAMPRGNACGEVFQGVSRRPSLKQKYPHTAQLMTAAGNMRP